MGLADVLHCLELVCDDGFCEVEGVEVEFCGVLGGEVDCLVGVFCEGFS